MSATTKQQLQAKIQSSRTQDLSQNFADYACVALILRGEIDDLELGYIVRATNPNDRWSGQIAFPGGRRELQDKNDIETSIRETLEEIGFQLRPEHLLGKINDVQARKGGQKLEFYIRPFVFYVPEEMTLNLNADEAADFFFRKVSDLRDSNMQTTVEIDWLEAKVKMPAIEMKKAPKLWGLSYLMTLDLLKVLE